MSIHQSDIKAFYRRYISFINERRTDDLSEFVHDELLYNEKRITRPEYQDLIATSLVAAPDIYFDVAILIANDSYIASRIDFNCTPIDIFLGFQPTGKAVSFSEHVFYRLRNGKICQVWSLIDLPSVQAQLYSETS